MKLATNLFLMFALFSQSLGPIQSRKPANLQEEKPANSQQLGIALARPTKTPTPTATVPPVETPTPIPSSTPVPTEPSAPVIGLSLNVEPQFVKPGDKFNLFWQVDGLDAIQEDAFLRFYAPSGVSLLDDAAQVDAENGTIDLPILSLKDKAMWQADETFALPAWIEIEFWQGGEMQLQAVAELQSQEEFLIDKQGGNARGLDGQVNVYFPGGALSESVKVKIGRPSEKSLPVDSLSGAPFEITAVSDKTQTEVFSFSAPIEIQVHYDVEAMRGDEENIRLFWYDPTDGQWKFPLDQQIDIENNLIIAHTDHFTVFDTYNSGWQSAETPTMDFFQHAGYTGASSFSMPIKVPAGPGGFQPSLSLSYSGQVVDSVTTDSQASWVGMGWSFDAGGYIERNGAGSFTTNDDSYSLNANGMSGALWPDGNGQYHMESENFAKITYDSGNDAWVILGKDGTKYYFEEIAGYTKTTHCPDEPPVVEIFVWRWMLKRVENIYGQTMTYSYARESQTAINNTQACPVTHNVVNAIYPENIVYANGRYRIHFNRIARYDYNPAWLNLYTQGVFKVFQLHLLDEIRMEQDADGNGTFETLIRKYKFNYCTDGTCGIFPAHIWPTTQQWRTPALSSVQEYGLNGSNSLPAYQFFYTDGMHLTSASNGYGGTVEFAYENWYQDIYYGNWYQGILPEDLPDAALEPHIPRWGNPLKCTFEESVCGWVPVFINGQQKGFVSGGNMQQNDLPDGYILMNGLIQMPVQSYQAGRYYRMVAAVQASNGTGTRTLQFGYRYIVDGVQHEEYLLPVADNLTLTTKIIESEPFQLPEGTTRNSFYTRLLAETGSVKVYWYYLVPMPTYARVTSKTVSAGSSYAFSYDYDNPAMNTSVNSAVLATAHPYSAAYSEFRGHGIVTETDPYGKKTITTYGQTDQLKGRSLSVVVKDQNNVTLQSSATAYGWLETASPAILLDQEWPHKNVPFTGLQYRWTWTDSETKTVFDAAGLEAGSSTTAYEYGDYGNLITQTQSGTDVDTVITHTDYFPNPSAYLVGLPARTWTESGSNTLTESLNLYDDHLDYQTPPSNGYLTGRRSLLYCVGDDCSVPGNRRYADIETEYDNVGNPIIVTSYKGDGALSSVFTGDAISTYTCYGYENELTLDGTLCPDDGYYTYPLWTKDALHHKTEVDYSGIAVPGTSYDGYALGVPVSETDPNNATTSATYDVFGRFTSLTRPNTGSDISPSLTVEYENSPFKVTLRQFIDASHTFTVIRNYDGLGRQYQTDTNNVLVNSTFDAYGRVLSQSTPRTGSETTYYSDTAYDALGRPLTVSDFHLTGVSAPILTTYSYNGLTTTVTDAKTHTHTTVTDILGRTLSVTPPATTDNSTPPVTFTYDPLGNMKTATRDNAMVELFYDNAGRKTDMHDPDMGNWSYAYDALGSMTRQQDAKNQVLCLYYDNLNRPKGKNYLTGGATCPTTDPGVYTVAYNYDSGANGIGRRVSMSVSGGDYTSWDYDIRGRVTSENKQIPGSGQFTTSFTYNSADLPVTMTYPVDNEVITFNYNNNMQLTKVFNEMGTPTNFADDINYAQTIAYDSAMRMIQLVRGANKLSSVFDYNDWNVDGGRLQNLTTTRPADSATLQNITYDYDVVGNINTIADSNGATPPVVQTQSFTYDELDRLLSSSVTGGTNGIYSEGYTYETSTGNLKTKNGATYNYDTTHKHAVASVGSNSYGYDDNGNMTSRHIVDQSGTKDFTLNYDAENRLASVTGAATANFTYNADGQQVKSIVNGVTTYYVGQHYEKKGTTVTKYYFAGATRIAVRTDGTLSYLLGDHLGSSSVTTDANGGFTASALYKAFGETRYTTGNLGTDYKFTGQREEASLGIYFFNARWYDGSLGRFRSPDTIVPTGTQGTQAWDRYAFVNNNPVRYNDPTGHMIDQGEGGCGDDIECTYETLVSCGCFQATINLVMDNYNILTAEYINGEPTYDPLLEEEWGDDTYGNTNPDGTVEIGPDAFSSPGSLAAHIAHEGLHAMQLVEGRYYDRTDLEGGSLNEVEANDFVIATADDYGLTEAEVVRIQGQRDYWNSQFVSPENQIRVNQGIYTKFGNSESSWLLWVTQGGWW